MTGQAIGILLAEDTDDMRFLLSAAFADGRFDVVTLAARGDEALQIWRDHRDRIRAAALDHRMPGMDGLEVAKAILAEAPGLPIVLFTAELDRELAAEASAIGVDLVHKDEILRLPDHPAFADL